MDPVNVLTQRLRHFADGMRMVNGKEFVPPTLEEWLEFWDDDDSDIGNLRNLEHWLSVNRSPVGGARVRSAV